MENTTVNDILQLGKDSESKLFKLKKLLASNEWKEIIEVVYYSQYLNEAVDRYANTRSQEALSAIESIGYLRKFLYNYKTELEINVSNALELNIGESE